MLELAGIGSIIVVFAAGIFHSVIIGDVPAKTKPVEINRFSNIKTNTLNIICFIDIILNELFDITLFWLLISLCCILKFIPSVPFLWFSFLQFFLSLSLNFHFILSFSSAFSILFSFVKNLFLFLILII